MEIAPHLIKCHNEIYLNHVQEWEWLATNKNDWKWWWWASQKWWNNISCEECNILWHKYENEIEVHEVLRKKILISNSQIQN